MSLEVQTETSAAELGAAQLTAQRRVPALVSDYIALTKPRVISLLLWITVATMFVAGRPSLVVVLATVLGGYLAAGGAGAINHFTDREIDRRMARTSRRPVASGRIHPAAALWFGVALGALSFSIMALLINVLAASLATAALLFYVFVYTLWLKPTTPQSIVIGGAAGAVPPLVGWVATTGHLDFAALYLFAIVFYWTPPHFWALSLLIKDDYAKTGIPMLPLVRGEAETRRQIYLYTWLLMAVTLLPFAGQLFGAVYLGAASVLGTGFLTLATTLLSSPSRRVALRLYLYSLLYLALLFSAMVADKLL